MLPILKILTPKVLKKIMSYVFDKNDLDYKVEKLQKRVIKLEESSHPPREFVTCSRCKKEIKEAGIATQSLGDECI